jgi:hypothetical protein
VYWNVTQRKHKELLQSNEIHKVGQSSEQSRVHKKTGTEVYGQVNETTQYKKSCKQDLELKNEGE